MDLNCITIQGRLTRDPEIKTIQSGKQMTIFSIANNETKEKCCFFNCVAFDKTAEFVNQWFKKGHMIIIQGRIQSNKKEDKEYFSIVCDKVTFSGSKPKEETLPKQEPEKEQPKGDDEDIPF